MVISNMTYWASVQATVLVQLSRLHTGLQPVQRSYDWARLVHGRWSTSACKTCFSSAEGNLATLCER